jgi:hypothetical protein
VNKLLSAAGGKHSAVLGLDIGKDEIVACLRWGIDDYERTWSISNPVEIGSLVEVCKKIVNHGVELTMSVGVYELRRLRAAGNDQDRLEC